MKEGHFMKEGYFMKEEHLMGKKHLMNDNHPNKELEKQIDFLMSAALQKCGNLQEAEELTQETLLAALHYLSQGREIENLQGWLITVLNRRFYDRMRRKYRRPSIYIGISPDLADEEGLDEKLIAAEEAESVRREVAYLARIYREAIVRHYMDGESVTEIAVALNLPEGTVKRRLYTGRSQIKKGITDMKNYTSQSYQPVTLIVGNSGGYGLNGEPASLVHDDLMAQNLLWLAYEKPATIEELSRSIGIPTAYVESVVEKLTRGELMRQTGNKYYTDFIISTMEDQERFLPEQKQFVRGHFDVLWENVEDGIRQLRKSRFYETLNSWQRNSLELYFSFKCLEEGYYGTLDKMYQSPQVLPARPNGGSWIAIGMVRLGGYEPEKHKEYNSCRWSGERRVRFEDYGDSRQIALHVYGTEGFPGPCYRESFQGIGLVYPGETLDAMLLKLLYTLHRGYRPNQLGFNPEVLKAVPGLTRCGVLRMENGKPVVNIPVMDREQFAALQALCREKWQALSAGSMELLREFLKGKKQPIPAHLDSVPLQKQYMWATQALMLTTIREAIRHGTLYDGDYDNPGGGNPVPCPMVMVIEP